MKQPPVRLVDSPDVSPAERELLDAARALPPVRYDVAAGATRFRAALEAAAVGGGLGGAGAAVGGGGVAGKLVVALIVVGAGAGTYLASRSPDPRVPVVTPAQPAAVPPTKPAAAAMPTAVAPEPATAAAPVDEPPELEAPVVVQREPAQARMPRARPSTQQDERDEPAPGTGATPQAQAREGTPQPAVRPEPALDSEPEVQRTSPKPAAAEPAPPPQESIDELRAIASARRLLARDPRAALTLLERLARERPQGYFVEERRALTVLSLAALGEDERAEAGARAFLRAYPFSPHAERVRAVLKR